MAKKPRGGTDSRTRPSTSVSPEPQAFPGKDICESAAEEHKATGSADTVEATAIPEPQEPSPAKSFPVVGIGASAGGLEAFKAFLKGLPAGTGMAFVLVQHMDPTHESMLNRLLAKDTEMPVMQVVHGMSVEPNSVYVIPPNTEMTISGGILRLVGRPSGVAWHTPIDTFLCSLAEDQRMRAIGIILSGIGSDGTKGLQAIKAEGGITLAQDEESSRYPGMPLHAVAAGCVDLVMPPEQIAVELARMTLHPYLQLAPEAFEWESPSAGDGSLHRIFLMVRSVTGVDFTNYKQSTIRRRIARRMVLRRCETLAQYAQYVSDHPEEVKPFFEDLLIHVTSFFRDTATFQFLRTDVFPRICTALEPGEPIRIWVPGCSSGEEVYSIAIVLHEFLGEKASQTPIQIFATDISEVDLQKARAAVYSESALAEVSPERLRRFFVKSEAGYRIAKLIRDSCVFARHDVTKDPPFSRMDLISCRNLLIYLASVLQKKVLNYLHYALKSTGCLILGRSEGINAAPDLFTAENREASVYMKLASSTHVPTEFQAVEHKNKVKAADSTRVFQAPLFDLSKEAERIILQRYAPPGLVLDSALQIVHIQGDTSPFIKLSPGRPSFNVLKLVQPDLILEIRVAIQEAKKSGAPVRRENIQFKHDKQVNLVDLEVVSINSHVSKGVGFVVLFKELRAVASGKTPRTAAAGLRTTKDSTHIEQIKRELAATQQNLRTVIEDQESTSEELRASNAELLSNNEELQSTNEELETAKEELHSSNEELSTLNDELQNRNAQVTRAASDLNSLLDAVETPVVILGKDLRIRHFTPAAAKLMNLIPGDIGRPISRVRPNLDLPNLDTVSSEVIQTGHSLEKEVRDTKGHWYALRARPHRTGEEVEGVVITVVDINDIKLLSTAIVETITEPLLVMDVDFRVVSANRAFYDKFRVTQEQTENRFLFELGEGQWNIPRLRELLERLLPDEKTIESFVVEHDFPAIGRKTMLLNARQLYQDGIGAEKILLVIEDITDSKAAGEALSVGR